MARLDTNDASALQAFAGRCGCSQEELEHAIRARGANEMDIVSFLALRGYISNDAFLRVRNEIS